MRNRASSEGRLGGFGYRQTLMDVVESDRQVAPPGVHLISILLCLLSLEIKLEISADTKSIPEHQQKQADKTADA